MARSWLDVGATLSVEYPDGTEVAHTDFQTELARSPFRSHGRVVLDDNISQQKLKPHWDALKGFEDIDSSKVPDHMNVDFISNLVLASRPQFVAPSLLGIRHRLTSESTIFLLTDGMGVLEEIYEKVWPDVETRPHFVLGSSSHTIQRMPAAKDPHFMSKEENYFRVLRWKQTGTLSVAAMPKWDNMRDPEAFLPLEEKPKSDSSRELAATTRYLLKTLRRTPILVPTFMSPMEYHLQSLENLATQSILGAVVSMTDSRQAHLLYNWPLTVSMRVLAHEISMVLRSLPEVQGYPNLEERFAPERIISLVTALCFQKKHKIPTAVYEMRMGIKPAVEYLNGYVVKRGEELGLRPVVNYFMNYMIKGKSLMVRHEVEEGMDLDAHEYPAEVQTVKYP
jgi:2-dehydropantoate 2-reductase